MTDTNRIREALAAYELIGEGDWTPQDVLGKRAIDALVARLEAAEAVAAQAKRLYDGWVGAEPHFNWNDLADALAAWERSQETGQPT